MRKIQFLAYFMAFTLSVFYSSCTESSEPETEIITPPNGNDDENDDDNNNEEPAVKRGLFITNEGNFTYGNASLSYYDIDSKEVENDVFYRVNGAKLGDVAQSMAISGDYGFVVINNSAKVEVIDKNTFKSVGKITGLTSPDRIHVVSDDKAYITDMYSTIVTAIDPKTLATTASIDLSASTEPTDYIKSSTYGKNLFVYSWAYGNNIQSIDTDKNKLANTIETGQQPISLVVDKNDKIWITTDGGYEGSPNGYFAPTLCRIDAKTGAVEKTFEFTLGDYGVKACLNGTRDTLYYINKNIWKIPVNADKLPSEPFIIPDEGSLFYGLAVDPKTSEVYVSDALNYTDKGMVYRYDVSGNQVDAFRVGIVPGSFCFKD